MKADTSFSQKLRAGWTKERLMTYYALTEAQYERVMECLKAIGSVGSGVA
jgi:hypothetical protein